MMPIAIRTIPMIPAGFTFNEGLDAPAGDQINDQDDDGHHEQQVEKRTDDVADGEAEKPENQKHDEDSPEHMVSFGLVSSASCAEPPVRLRFFDSSDFRPRGRLLHKFE